MILLRTEGNGTIGMGHVTRSVALAEVLRKRVGGRGESVLFQVDEWSQPAAWYVRAHGFHMWEPQYGAPRITINDFHQSTTEGEGVVFELVDELHEAKGPLAFSAFDRPEHAILREEFRDCPPRPTRHEAQRILITFGGADPAHHTERIVPLALRTGLQVDVVVGPAFGERPELRTLQGVTLHQGGHSMAELLATADVVVCSAGMTVLEAAAVGIPALVMGQNKREYDRAERLHRASLCYHTNIRTFGLDLPFLLRESVRVSCAKLGQALVDGRGAQRVAQAILTQAAARGAA